VTSTTSVSADAEKALRAAMNRLLNGTSRHTDGRLTKGNLGREAQLSHATVHRATALLREWDQAVAARRDSPNRQQPKNEQVAELPKCRIDKTDECRDPRKRLEVAATFIATLHHENNALRAQLSRTAIVLPVDFTPAAAQPGTVS
jgi:hypothetical protein